MYGVCFVKGDKAYLAAVSRDLLHFKLELTQKY